MSFWPATNAPSYVDRLWWKPFTWSSVNIHSLALLFPTLSSLLRYISSFFVLLLSSFFFFFSFFSVLFLFFLLALYTAPCGTIFFSIHHSFMIAIFLHSLYFLFDFLFVGTLRLTCHPSLSYLLTFSFSNSYFLVPFSPAAHLPALLVHPNLVAHLILFVFYFCSPLLICPFHQPEPTFIRALNMHELNVYYCKSISIFASCRRPIPSLFTVSFHAYALLALRLTHALTYCVPSFITSVSSSFLLWFRLLFLFSFFFHCLRLLTVSLLFLCEPLSWSVSIFYFFFFLFHSCSHFHFWFKLFSSFFSQLHRLHIRLLPFSHSCVLFLPSSVWSGLS